MLLIAVAIGLAMSAGTLHWRWLEEQSRLRQVLDETGAERRRPGSVTELRRESDPLQARLAVASSLLADLLDGYLPGQTAGTEDPRIQTAVRAQALARQALEVSPYSWRARLLLGAATYIERSLARDERLVRQYRDWEEPLVRALEMAPHEPEPVRFLTMAYLEIWPMLSTEKRDRTREMLTLAFSDRRLFDRYLEAWLAVAGSHQEALEVLPNDRHVWEGLRSRFATRGDLEAAAYCHQRLLRAYDEGFAAALEDGVERLRAGDFRNGRDRLQILAAGIPPDRRWLSLFVETVESLPPGPLHRQNAQSLELWLRWNLDRCLFDQCLLPRPVQERLTRWVEPNDPLLRARAVLASGDLVAAERLEPFEPTATDWSPYWLQKAALLLERGDPRAGRALARVGSSWRQDALFFYRLEGVRDLDPRSSANVEIDLPSARGARSRADRWRTEDWRQRQLALWPSRTSSGLVLNFSEPIVEDLIEIVWNGAGIGTLVVDPRTPTATIEVEVGTELQLLELRSLAFRTSSLPAVALKEELHAPVR